jgi:LacI family transcriptional regulator
VVTLRDVADRAGVSPATASHAINGTRPVSRGSRERVLLAVRDLGYEPNTFARSLRVSRSMAIGVVISDISQPFFASAVRGIEESARQRGYTVVVCDTNEDQEVEAAALTMLRSRRVDGLIVVPAGAMHDRLRQVVDSGIPLVWMDRELPDRAVSCATLDNALAASTAVGHLFRHGHRRIGLIATKRGISTSRDRRLGYVQALEEGGLSVDEELVTWGELGADSGAEAMRSLIRLADPPTAVFVGGNHVTIGALSALRQAGLRVPEDVALIGHADSEWWKVFTPALSTIQRPTQNLGTAAASLVFDQIASSEPLPVKRVSLRCDLQVRESCGTHACELVPGGGHAAADEGAHMALEA